MSEALVALLLARGCQDAVCPCRNPRDELISQCRGVMAARRARAREVTERFQGTTIPGWARETPLLGAEVTFVLDGGATQLLGEVAPTRPGRRNGAVRAPRGEGAATSWREEPGRGLYQTSWTRGTARYGDGEYHRGIELHWTRANGTAQAWITAWVLIDDWRRPAAWPVR